MEEKIINQKIKDAISKLSVNKRLTGGYKYSVEGNVIKLYVWTPKKEYNIDIEI